MVEPLVWDSGFFGLKTGRLELQADAELEPHLQSARSEGYELIYLYSLRRLQAADSGRFTLLDVGGQITYRKAIAETPQPAVIGPGWQRVSAGEPDPGLLQLAYLSGHLSRFHIDRRLPQGSFERLYQSWLRRSLEDRETAVVHRAGPVDDPAGLITASWQGQRCRIELLAVSPHCWGQGVAAALVAGVEALCRPRGATNIQVKTQLSNIQARRFYEKHGYLESNSQQLYHVYPQDLA